MSKSKKKKTTLDYSSTTPSIQTEKLKTDAVQRLVEAAHGDASGVNEEDVKKATKKDTFLSKIPVWIKAIVLKWWFMGATCFFFLWGLGNYINSHWDQILVLGLATGAVTDLLENNFFRLLETSEKEYHPYMMIGVEKKLWTLFANVAYSFVLTILVVYTYQGINTLVIRIQNLDSNSVPLAVEPLLYGLFYLVYDMAFIGIKDLIIHLIHKKEKAIL